MDKPVDMLKCKSCEGEYEPICDNGMEYYHACAPIIDIEGKITEHTNKRDENIGKFEEGKGVEAVNINK